MSVTLIQFRRGTAAEWVAENPVLAAGEPGFETDTGLAKVGDGTTAWVALGYTGDPAAPMDEAEATAGVAETPRTLSAAVLAAAIAQLGPQASPSNVYMQPLWDGTGDQPGRPDYLPGDFFVIWRQPVAPLAGEGYAQDGDEWEVTQGVG